MTLTTLFLDGRPAESMALGTCQEHPVSPPIHLQQEEHQIPSWKKMSC